MKARNDIPCVSGVSLKFSLGSFARGATPAARRAPLTRPFSRPGRTRVSWRSSRRSSGGSPVVRHVSVFEGVMWGAGCEWRRAGRRTDHRRRGGSAERDGGQGDARHLQGHPRTPQAAFVEAKLGILGRRDHGGDPLRQPEPRARHARARRDARLQPLHPEPHAAPGPRNRVRAFRDSPMVGGSEV
jgi:hypothetical protein